MLYLLHGEDDYRRGEWLAEMRRTVSLDEGMASLNTSVLDGRRVTPEELEATCGATPFLADKRLVIVEGLASRLEPPKDERRRKVRAPTSTEKRMLDYLAMVPASTDLVLAEDRDISALNAFAIAVAEAGGRIVCLPLPKADSQELKQWLAERSRHHGAHLSPDAVEQLLAFVGNDLRLLDSELAKLAAFGEGQTVTVDQVRQLVSYTRETVIFELTDALGHRDVRAALRKARELLDEGESSYAVLGMVGRHISSLLRARDLLDRGVPAAAFAGELGGHPYVAQKAREQARSFSLAALRRLHGNLVELDWKIKTGKMEPEAALDLFIAAVAGR